MENKDIFDEEFEKISQSSADDTFDSWANYNELPQKPQKSNRPLHIVLISVAIVVCIALGWILAIVVNPDTADDERKDILGAVIDKMDVNFYEEITDEEWAYAVEVAGSMLMQYAGDQYSYLMSPQTYYNTLNGIGESSYVVDPNKVFGVTYTMETNGMVVSGVETDTACYGNLQSGDLIFRLSNIKAYKAVMDGDRFTFDQDGYLQVERNSVTNQPIVYTVANAMELANRSTEEVHATLGLIHQATFHVFRNGQVLEQTITRNNMGMQYDQEDVNPSMRYDFAYVEYYFGATKTNVSTTNQNGASTNTYVARNLASLPADTGYIRLIQFDMAPEHLDTPEQNVYTHYGSESCMKGDNYKNYAGECCYAEMRIAMDLFKESGLKYLVLDLKGNPGGYVHLATDIAGLFITDRFLSSTETSQLKKSGSIFDNGSAQWVITTLVEKNGDKTVYSTNYIGYDHYFGVDAQDVNKKRVIIWTDGGSASASELLTGALKDYKTAVQMGTRTYGKGIAQNIDELDITGTITNIQGKQEQGCWAVYYTFAKYYPPLSGNIHGNGYEPSTIHQADNYVDLWTVSRTYWAI